MAIFTYFTMLILIILLIVTIFSFVSETMRTKLYLIYYGIVFVWYMGIMIDGYITAKQVLWLRSIKNLFKVNIIFIYFLFSLSFICLFSNYLGSIYFNLLFNSILFN